MDQLPIFFIFFFFLIHTRFNTLKSLCEFNLYPRSGRWRRDLTSLFDPLLATVYSEISCLLLAIKRIICENRLPQSRWNGISMDNNSELMLAI